MGSSWGHVGLQNRLGPAQERTRSDAQRQHTKKHPQDKPVKVSNEKAGPTGNTTVAGRHFLVRGIHVYMSVLCEFVKVSNEKGGPTGNTI